MHKEVSLEAFESFRNIGVWEFTTKCHYISDYMMGMSIDELSQKYKTHKNAINILLNSAQFKHLKNEVKAIRAEMEEEIVSSFINEEKLRKTSAYNLSNIKEKYFKMSRLLRGDNAELDPVQIDVEDLARRLSSLKVKTANDEIDSDKLIDVSDGNVEGMEEYGRSIEEQKRA